jgi:hypothetical protein
MESPGQFSAEINRDGTVTSASPLSEVLDAADRLFDPTGARPEDRACLAGLRAARRLAEAPAWRALQGAVSRAGIPPAESPVLALFAAAGETVASPRDLTRDWAWQHERGLRPDLRITFSAKIGRLDTLRTHPVLVDCGLLPAERLGPMLPRGGRHRHAVYPLPRSVEAAIAALDASDAERFSIEGSVHFIWHLARDAGLYQPGDAPVDSSAKCNTNAGRGRGRPLPPN